MNEGQLPDFFLLLPGIFCFAMFFCHVESVDRLKRLTPFQTVIIYY